MVQAGKRKQSELLPDHSVSLEAAFGVSPGSPAGTGSVGAGPGKMEVCRIHLLLTCHLLTEKVKTLLVSGAVRGHILVCNRAAFILDCALLCSSQLSFSDLLPSLSTHLHLTNFLKPLTSLLETPAASKPLVSRADSLLILSLCSPQSYTSGSFAVCPVSQMRQ